MKNKIIIFLDFDGVLHPSFSRQDNFFCQKKEFETAIRNIGEVDSKDDSKNEFPENCPNLAICKRYKEFVEGVSGTFIERVKFVLGNS